MRDCGTFASPFPPSVRTVGICALCGVADRERAAQGVARLESWALNVRMDALADAPERFLAADDTTRARRFNELVRVPEVDLILAARGGYGSARVLDLIDWEALRERRIPVVGYSDMTAFHLAAFGKGIATGVSGPMLAGYFARSADSAEEICGLRTVFSSLADVLGEVPTRVSLRSLRSGIARGPLVPANLAILCSLVGTDHLPSLRGCILALEDINEAAYRIDRFLNQLLQAGVLETLGGLVFGQFTDCEDAEFIPAVLADFARHVSGPVAAGLPFGHGFPSLSLPVGPNARLAVDDDKAVLEIRA
ncbi:MAG: LD-carboxypeptidase [Lentisphaeria bacterium]|nr:LD-carboxypeptidase [Lentisphaeria bacterium]